MMFLRDLRVEPNSLLQTPISYDSVGIHSVVPFGFANLQMPLGVSRFVGISVFVSILTSSTEFLRIPQHDGAGGA